MSNIRIFAVVVLILTIGLSFFYLRNFGTSRPVSYTTPEEAYEQGRYFNMQDHFGSISAERAEENLKSDAKALRFAAERGHLKAAAKLGEMYANGIGVKKDVTEAIKWYEKGAKEYDLEDIDNLVQLCGLYSGNLGEVVNYSKALEYCQRAGQYAWPAAHAFISDFYFNGWGVKKDDVEAYFWMKLANHWAVSPRESGYDLAKEEKLSALLTEKEKQVVMTRVQAWKPKDRAETNGSEMLEHCTQVLSEERAKQPVSDEVAEVCLRRCRMQLRPQDPRYAAFKSCPYWKWPSER